jgi:hypothetical protein
VLNHSVKSFLARLLANRGVRFDVATHDLLKPAQNTLSNAR